MSGPQTALDEAAAQGVAVRRVAATALIVVVAAGIGNLAWDHKVVPWVAARVAQRLGRRVDIERLTLTRQGVRARGVRVYGRAPFDGTPFLTIERADVQLDWSGGQLVARAISVHGGDLELLASDGINNVFGVAHTPTRASDDGTNAQRGAESRSRHTAAAHSDPSVDLYNVRVHGLIQLPHGVRVGFRSPDFELDRTPGGTIVARASSVAVDVIGVASASLAQVTLTSEGGLRQGTLRAFRGRASLVGANPLVTHLDARVSWTPDGTDVALADDNDLTEGRMLIRLHAGADGTRADLQADSWPLAGLSPMVDYTGVDVGRAQADVTAQVTVPHQAARIPFSFAASVRHADVHHGALDRGVWFDVPAELSAEGTFMPGSDRFEVSAGRARVLGLPIDLTGHVQLGRKPRGEFRLQTPDEGVLCSDLWSEQPAAVQAALWGLRLGGRLRASAAVTFDAAAWESLALQLDVSDLCTALAEPDDLHQALPTLVRGEAPTLPSDPWLRTQRPAHALRTLPLGPYNATFVPLRLMPKHLVSAFLAAEDDQFFHHHGFRAAGIERALAHDLEVGSFARGASTITQQLAKNLFLPHDRTLARKLEETVFAWRLESCLSKDRILELYLNIVEMGPNIVGVPQAAEVYFGRAPGRLSALESAHLAALTPNPVGFARRFREGRVDDGWLQRLYDLLGMMKRGGGLSSADLASARTEKLQLNRI